MILIAQFLLVFMLFPFEISHWLYDSTILVSQVCLTPKKKKKKKKRDLEKANKSKLHFFISLFYYHHFFGNKIDIFLNIPIFPSKLYIFLKFITFSFFLGREFDLFQEREIGLQWIYGTFFFKDLKKEIAKMFHVEMIINKIYYMKNHRRA